MTTPLLSLPELVSGQSQPHVPINEALRALDVIVQLAALGLSNTPPGSPSDGDRYLVDSAPTGAWAAHANTIAYYVAGSFNEWRFISPRLGWFAYSESEDAYYRYIPGSPGGWILFVSGDGAQAATIAYDNVSGWLSSTNVQDALDELGSEQIIAQGEPTSLSLADGSGSASCPTDHQNNANLYALRIRTQTTFASSDATLSLGAIPDFYWPGSDQWVLCRVIDNGVIKLGICRINSADGTVSFGADVTGLDGFTGSGTKGLPEQTISYAY